MISIHHADGADAADRYPRTPQSSVFELVKAVLVSRFSSCVVESQSNKPPSAPVVRFSAFRHRWAQ